MEQNAPTWNSSLLKGLGASTLKIPGEDAGSKVKKFAAALSLAALAAMSSFAPNVAHAAPATTAAIELPSTVITPEQAVVEEAQVIDQSAEYTEDPNEPIADSRGKLDIEGDNPYRYNTTLPDREKGIIDKLDTFLNGAPMSREQEAAALAAEKAQMDNNPLINNPVVKTLDAIISPLDAVVNLVTDEGSEANKAALKIASVTNTAIKYSSAGPAALATDAYHGVKSGVSSARHMLDDDQQKVQDAVNAANQRMAKIYVAERERMAAEQSGGAKEMSASRVDISKSASQGLETSTDGMDELFKAAPAKKASRDNESSLSR
jgi:hypothetical protein